MEAKAINVIPILMECYLEGERIIETGCLDYDHYFFLPEAIEYEGMVYCKTGWSSDTNRACYKTGVKFANPIG